LASRIVKDWVILECKRESTSVDLGQSVCVHELEESGTRICTEDVNLVAGTLIEPDLMACRQRRGSIGDVRLVVPGREQRQDGRP
jgi:hypothetical protein